MGRRMFSENIVESDAFLELPLSAQALYLHLSMAADDDGFVNNGRKITRVIGASPKDFEALIQCRFILDLGDGIVVIKHWFINNVLRKDRKKSTVYQDKAQTLKIKGNGAYTEKVSDSSQPNDNQSATKSQADGSIREEKGIEEKGIEEKNTYVHEFDELWYLYPRKQGRTNALKAYIKARKEGTTKEEIEQGILDYGAYIKTNNVEGRYIKMGSTWFNQRCWTDEHSMRVKSGKSDWIDEVEL